MEVPVVKKCTVSQCFYNQNDQCHAFAILVGSDHAMCDTFMSSSQHGTPAEIGKVGACHISGCEYNQSMMCVANGIDVGVHSGHADCLTFEPR